MATERRLIDVNYALRQLEIGEFENGGNFETDSYHIKEFLYVLPTVDAVEVVHGRWITPIITPWCFKCSECRTHHDTASNYCPNCGAIMDGDANG